MRLKVRSYLFLPTRPSKRFLMADIVMIDEVELVVFRVLNELFFGAFFVKLEL